MRFTVPTVNERTADVNTATGRLLDLPQLCDWLGLTERTVRNMAAKGSIPVTRLDGRLRFDVVAIEKWLRRNTQDAA